MSSLVFDTHAFIKKLTTAGMPIEQAEVLAEEQTRLIDNRLVTKDDLTKLETNLRAEFFSVRAKMTIMKWMLGIILAGVVSIVTKLFF